MMVIAFPQLGQRLDPVLHRAPQLQWQSRLRGFEFEISNRTRTGTGIRSR